MHSTAQDISAGQDTLEATYMYIVHQHNSTLGPCNYHISTK